MDKVEIISTSLAIIGLVITVIHILCTQSHNGNTFYDGAPRAPDEIHRSKEYSSPYILDENGELWVKYDTDNGTYIIEKASPEQSEEYLHLENKLE